MSRQARRKARKLRKSQEEPLIQGDSEAEVNWDHVRARFANLQGRSVNVGYVPVGPLVEARTPEELEANTAIALKRDKGSEN